MKVFQVIAAATYVAESAADPTCSDPTCNDELLLLQTRVEKMDAMTTDTTGMLHARAGMAASKEECQFWTDCGFKDLSELTPTTAFTQCCTDAGHTNDLCSKLINEVFKSGTPATFEDVTSTTCAELTGLEDVNYNWAHDQSQGLDRVVSKKSDPTPSPTLAPTPGPTPSPTALVNDFFIGVDKCNYSPEELRAIGPPKAAFRQCCEDGGHASDTCSDLADNVFRKDAWDFITEDECREMDGLEGVHNLWRAEQQGLVGKSRAVDSTLRDKNPRRRRRRRTPSPTPSPTNAPTFAPTPEPTPDYTRCIREGS